MMDVQKNSRLALLQDVAAESLMIHEIYASIQGESSHAGLPCTFVRTSACHLRCRYCDTAHAFHTGQSMALEAIEDAVVALGHPLGATGAKLMTTLVHELKRQEKRYGLQTMCEGGGQANVTILENLCL